VKNSPGYPLSSGFAKANIASSILSMTYITPSKLSRWAIVVKFIAAPPDPAFNRPFPAVACGARRTRPVNLCGGPHTGKSRA
jgi:hypothetical protein